MDYREPKSNYYKYLKNTDKFKAVFRDITEISKKGGFTLRFPYDVSFDAGEQQYFKDNGFSLTMFNLQGTGWVLSWLGTDLKKEDI